MKAESPAATGLSAFLPPRLSEQPLTTAGRVSMVKIALIADAATSSGMTARRTLDLATAVKRTLLQGAIAG